MTNGTWTLCVDLTYFSRHDRLGLRDCRPHKVTQGRYGKAVTRWFEAKPVNQR